MKKSGLVFAISFITYVAAFFASPYVTAQLWADCLAFLFFAALIYQLLYIIFLRKSESVSLGRAIARFFLFTAFSAEAIIVIYHADNFINGYTPTGFWGEVVGDTVYGFDAILADGWANFLFVPALIICTVYQIAYFAVSYKIKKPKSDKE